MIAYLHEKLRLRFTMCMMVAIVRGEDVRCCIDGAGPVRMRLKSHGMLVTRNGVVSKDVKVAQYASKLPCLSLVN